MYVLFPQKVICLLYLIIDLYLCPILAFCDISKTFDSVAFWHSGLLHKLQEAGVTGDALNWFKGCLADRKERVVLPGTVSEWKCIRAGVPKGYIRDIPEDYNPLREHDTRFNRK